MNKTNRKIHDGISMLKGIACVIVVFLHASFPGILGKLIGSLLVFPVPIFFAVTGYFTYKKSDNIWIKRKAFYIFKMIVITEVVYGIWSLLYEIFYKQRTLYDFISSVSFVKNPLRVMLCGTAFNGTLWYLYAMFWTFIIYLLIFKKISNKKTYLLIPILSTIGIFGRLIYQNNFDISGTVYIFRNALFIGLPMTLLGSFVALNETRLKKVFTPLKSVVCIFLGYVLTVLEYILSHLLFDESGMDFHVSTIIISFGLFMFFLNYSEIKRKSFILYIGKNLYMPIYLSHLMFLNIINLLIDYFNLNNSTLIMWIRPILVLILSITFAQIFYIVKSKKHKERI